MYLSEAGDGSGVVAGPNEPSVRKDSGVGGVDNQHQWRQTVQREPAQKGPLRPEPATRFS